MAARRDGTEIPRQLDNATIIAASVHGDAVAIRAASATLFGRQVVQAQMTDFEFFMDCCTIRRLLATGQDAKAALVAEQSGCTLTEFAPATTEEDRAPEDAEQVACEATAARVSRIPMAALLTEARVESPTRDTYLYVDLVGQLVAKELPRHWRAAPHDEYLSLGWATQTVGVV